MNGYNNTDDYDNNNQQIVVITRISSQKAYYNFIDAIKSPETKKKYSHLLLKYIKDHLNLDKEDLADLLLEDPKKIEYDIITYIKILRDKEKLAYSTINTRIAALYLFFTMNDIVLNRKKINRYLGEHIKTIKDRAYTREEIKKIIERCDLKFKVVVSLMASSGCRIGAIPSLILKNLKYIEKYELYKVTFYENTKSEYYSFTTPEFSKYLREYLSFRERCGESLNQKSPLIRNDFVMDDLLRVQNPKPLILGTLSVCLRQILIKTGLRVSNPQRERKDIAANHAFRKFTHTTMANAKINQEIREMLLGHSIGLSGAYYRPTEQEMLLEYLKVVNDLTIDPSHRLQKQVQELKEKEDYQTYTIEKKLKEKDQEIEQLKETMKNIFDQINRLKSDLINDKNHPVRRKIEEFLRTKKEQQKTKVEENKKMWRILDEIDEKRKEILSKKGFITKEDEELIDKSVLEEIKQTDLNLWKTVFKQK